MAGGGARHARVAAWNSQGRRGLYRDVLCERRGEGAGLALPLHFIEVGEDFSQRDANPRPFNAELSVWRLLQSAAAGNPGVTGSGIYNPDATNTHADVVVDAFLKTLQPILRGENLDADPGSISNDGLDRIGVV